ncbi:fumarylacetoacetate hydrolase [Halorubrum sp. E3]|nr:fumarylacetoacetate hydrolase [Halorubrum sp. E3]
MRYSQLNLSGNRRIAVTRRSETYDLTSANSDLRSFGDVARVASVDGDSIDQIATSLLDEAETIERSTVDEHATVPVNASEVWAAGVTYEISEQAREEESSMPDIYLDVYDAERPELFFKSTPSRTVGHREAVGIRGDSAWNVPEPELGIVLYRGEIVGFTIGNDVSSRSIGGDTPLYLPQAKVYDRSCSLGPCVVTQDHVDDPRDLEMEMTIERDGEVVYEDATNTNQMVRSCEELVSYFTRHNAVPELSVLLTGTSLVPEEPFDLREGDQIDITIEEIGTLSNGVVSV